MKQESDEMGMKRFRSRITLTARVAALAALALVAPACAPAVSSVGVVSSDAGYLPLWELSHEGGTLYVLGSVHLLRPEVYPLDDAIYDAFDRAETVVFEVDFGEMASAGPLMAERGMYGDDRTLGDAIPADLHAETRERATAAGLPAEVVDRMKPWMAAMTLSMLVLQQSGFEAATGLDLHLHERAVEAGKPVVGLETMEEQLAVFEDLPLSAQVAFLRSTLEQLDETVAMMDEATELWLRGDTYGLAELFVESMGDQPQLMEKLLYERNRNWVPQIEALLAEPGTAIVIVGMGHLAGEDSVIDLLARRGHEPRQVAAGGLVGAPGG